MAAVASRRGAVQGDPARDRVRGVRPGRRLGREVAVSGLRPAGRRVPAPAVRVDRALGDRTAAAAEPSVARAAARRRAGRRARLDERRLLRVARPPPARDRGHGRVPRPARRRGAGVPQASRLRLDRPRGPRSGAAHRGRRQVGPRLGARARRARGRFLGALHPARGADRPALPGSDRARAGDGDRGAC